MWSLGWWEVNSETDPKTVGFFVVRRNKEWDNREQKGGIGK
jgi:hypothetical protein